MSLYSETNQRKCVTTAMRQGNPPVHSIAARLCDRGRIPSTRRNAPRASLTCRLIVAASGSSAVIPRPPKLRSCRPPKPPCGECAFQNLFAVQTLHPLARSLKAIGPELREETQPPRRSRTTESHVAHQENPGEWQRRARSTRFVG
jgi:hypothetical protein